MKVKKLNLKKEIVANLSDAMLNQIRGGSNQGDTYCISLSCGSCGCGTPSDGGSCLCSYTQVTCDWSYCCGPTYAGFC